MAQKGTFVCKLYHMTSWVWYFKVNVLHVENVSDFDAEIFYGSEFLKWFQGIINTM
jgi:hypothetical protein